MGVSDRCYRVPANEFQLSYTWNRLCFSVWTKNHMSPGSRKSVSTQLHMKSPLFFSLNKKSYVAGFPQISFNPVTHEITAIFQFEQKIMCRQVPANQFQPGYTWNWRCFSVWTKNHVSPGSRKSISPQLQMKSPLFFSLNEKSCVAGFPQINFWTIEGANGIYLTVKNGMGLQSAPTETIFWSLTVNVCVPCGEFFLTTKNDMMK